MARGLQVVLVFTVLLLIAACASSPTPTPTAAPTPTPTVAQPTATPTSRPTAAPTEAPPTPGPTSAVTPTPLFMNVTAPANESIVSTQQVEVKGQTTPGAVVTVNSQVAEVDAEGNFSVTVTLDEGPNALEVLASDFEGNQASQVVTVIYVPA